MDKIKTDKNQEQLLDLVQITSVYNSLPEMSTKLSVQFRELADVFSCFPKHTISNLHSLICATLLHRHHQLADQEILLWRKEQKVWVSEIHNKDEQTKVIPISWMNDDTGNILAYEYIKERDISLRTRQMLTSKLFNAYIAEVLTNMRINGNDRKFGISCLQSTILTSIDNVSLQECTWTVLSEHTFLGRTTLNKGQSKLTSMNTGWAVSNCKILPITTCLIARH